MSFPIHVLPHVYSFSSTNSFYKIVTAIDDPVLDRIPKYQCICPNQNCLPSITGKVICYVISGVIAIKCLKTVGRYILILPWFLFSSEKREQARYLQSRISQLFQLALSFFFTKNIVETDCQYKRRKWKAKLHEYAINSKNYSRKANLNISRQRSMIENALKISF